MWLDETHIWDFNEVAVIGELRPCAHIWARSFLPLVWRCQLCALTKTDEAMPR